MPRKCRGKTNIQRIALIVIDGRVSRLNITLRRTDGNADQATRDISALFRYLIRICKVHLAELPQSWRLQSKFPRLNQRAVDRYREVDAGFPDTRMVEEVIHPRLKMVRIQQPSAERNLHAELVFLVVLAMQRNEGGVLAVRII